MRELGSSGLLSEVGLHPDGLVREADGRLTFGHDGSDYHVPILGMSTLGRNWIPLCKGTTSGSAARTKILVESNESRKLGLDRWVSKRGGA